MTKVLFMYMHIRSSTCLGRDARNYLHFFYGHNTYFETFFELHLQHTEILSARISP